MGARCNHPLSQFDTILAKLRKSLAAECVVTRRGPVPRTGRVSGGKPCAERSRCCAWWLSAARQQKGVGELQLSRDTLNPRLPRGPEVARGRKELSFTEAMRRGHRSHG